MIEAAFTALRELVLRSDGADASRRLAELNAAHRVLADPELRAAYDAGEADADPVPFRLVAAPDAPMSFIGVDLAWGRTNGSGLCLVRNGRVIDSARVLTDEEIIEWVRSRVAGAACLITFDAPLIVANEKSCRPCERLLGRWMGGRDASPHSSNTRNQAFANGPRGAELAATLGYGLDPFVPCGKPVRRAIEVYPHPALVALFELPKSLKYKYKTGRSIEMRRSEFRILLGLLRELRDASPSLEVERGNPRWQVLVTDIESATTQAALDRAEDELDAYICAYVGLHHWTHGSPRSRVIGTLAEGYIVTPASRADGTIDQTLADALDALSRLP